jgi:hypothetical protein
MKKTGTKFHTLGFSGATNAAAQMKLFKTCLGDSDGNKADNVEVDRCFSFHDRRDYAFYF